MSKKFKIIRNILIGLLIVALLIVASVFFAVRFVIVPDYNKSGDLIGKEKREITSGEVFEMAKYLKDKQFVDNMMNFDSEAAKEALSVLIELETELGIAPDTTKKPASQKNPEDIIGNVDLDSKQSSAYKRIMATADADEISAGLAIIAKIDLEKINNFYKAGKTDEMKNYIKSVLTPSEISTSLKLYNKYKHLL